ncbi:DUF1819 family protein, partial [bacterium]|nr:DUF1819 family protein [bacterium]
ASELRTKMENAQFEKIESTNVDGYVCSGYIKTRGTFSEENGKTVFKSKRGTIIENITQYPIPAAFAASNLGLRLDSEKNILWTVIDYSSPTQKQLCLVALIKTGSSLVGEFSCQNNSAGAPDEKSVMKPDLFAIQYVECKIPQVGM